VSLNDFFVGNSVENALKNSCKWVGVGSMLFAVGNRG